MVVDLLLLWIHWLAAISWIGGMLFLALVLVPILRGRQAATEVMTLFRTAARRFRWIVWSAIGVLFGTGPLLLHQRGWSLAEPTGWPTALRVKFALVAVLFFLTLLHDLLLGPRIRTMSALPEEARSSGEQALVRTATWVPRMALVIALAVVAAAVALARS